VITGDDRNGQKENEPEFVDLRYKSSLLAEAQKCSRGYNKSAKLTQVMDEPF